MQVVSNARRYGRAVDIVIVDLIGAGNLIAQAFVRPVVNGVHIDVKLHVLANANPSCDLVLGDARELLPSFGQGNFKRENSVCGIPCRDEFGTIGCELGLDQLCLSQLEALSEAERTCFDGIDRGCRIYHTTDGGVPDHKSPHTLIVRDVGVSRLGGCGVDRVDGCLHGRLQPRVIERHTRTRLNLLGGEEF